MSNKIEVSVHNNMFRGHSKNLKKLKIENVDFISIDNLKKFKKQTLKIKRNIKSIKIEISNLNFLNRSSLIYFESLIYLIFEQNITLKEVKILYKKKTDTFYYFDSSIINQFYDLQDGKYIIKRDEYLTRFNLEYDNKKTELSTEIRYHFKNKIDINDIFTTSFKNMEFFSDNIYTEVRSLMSELIVNVNNHDGDEFNVIIHFRKIVKKSGEFYEIGVLNFCGKNILENVGNHKKYKENFINTKNKEILLPYLFVSGVTTRDGKTMGGTGLGVLHEKMLLKVNRESHKYFTFIQMYNQNLDLSQKLFYKESDFWQNKKEIEKLVNCNCNPFNGVIYNVHLLNRRE